MLREPKSRSISGFFYQSHHAVCPNSSVETCFDMYTHDARYSNVVTKMLALNAEAYSEQSDEVTEATLKMAINSLDKFFLVAIAELWELSLMVLHHKLPFIKPDVEEFYLHSNETHIRGTRSNSHFDYLEFKAKSSSPRIAESLALQNSHDSVLYQYAVDLLCKSLHEYDLWSVPSVRSYWKDKSVRASVNCSV